MKWKLQIEMNLLGKNGIRIEIEFFFRMEITLVSAFHTVAPACYRHSVHGLIPLASDETVQSDSANYLFSS